MSDGGNDDGYRGRWRLIIAALAVLCLAVSLLAVWRWSASMDDLVAIDARAAAARVPCTWSELGLRQSDEPVLQRWHRLLQLSKALPCYLNSDNEYAWKGVQPGSPPPTAMQEHHARLPAVTVDDVLARCDGLGPDSVDAYADYTVFTRFDEIEQQRNLVRLLCERVVLVPPEQVGEESRRAIAVSLAQPARVLLQYMVAANGIARWQRAVTCRLHDPGLPRSELAHLADLARNWLETAHFTGLRGEFITARSFVLAIHNGDPRLRRGLGPQLGLPGWLDGFGLERPLARYQRGTLLATGLDMVDCWGSAPDTRGRLLAFRKLQARLDAAHSHGQLSDLLLADAYMSFRSWLKLDVGLQLLAAELRGEPWPIDPTDLAGRQVRRIERDSRLIGYYLLGKNEVDDGGRINRDDCVSLYEALGAERASDPLMPDPAPSTAPGVYNYGAQ